MIYVKQFDALFNSPEVKEPILPNEEHYITKESFHRAWIIYQTSIAAYQQWLSSKIEVVGEHTFQDGKDYEMGVHYNLEMQFNHGHFSGTQDWGIIPYGLMGGAKECFRVVAIPIKDDEPKRITAMKWWNGLSSARKTQICDTSTELVGHVRRWETLTGREITKLFEIKEDEEKET